MFCSATGSPASGTQNLKKRAVSFLSGSQDGEDGSARGAVSTLPSPSPFASGQQGPVQEHDASRTPCPTVEPGKCRTVHSDPTLGHTAFRVGSLCSTSLPHSGCIGGSTSPACSVSGGLASAPRRSRWLMRTIRLGYAIQFARRPPKSGGIRFTSVQDKDAPVLRHGPAGEGRDTAGPSSRDEGRVYSPYFIVSKKGGELQPILDLCVLNQALHKLPFRMLTQKRIFQCIRRGTQSRLLSEKLMCICPRCEMGCTWQSMHANCHWLVLLTLEGDWALGRDPIYVSHYDVTSPIPPSGNEGYLCNGDVILPLMLPLMMYLGNADARYTVM